MSITKKEYALLNDLLTKGVSVIALDHGASKQSIYQTLRRIRRKWEKAIYLNNQLLTFYRRGSADYRKLMSPKKSLIES